MKKSALFLFISLLLLNSGFAQKNFYKIQLEAALGNSILQIVSNYALSDVIDVKITPVYDAKGFLFVGKRIALGLGVDYQRFYYYYDTLKITVTARKLNLGAIGRFYYLNTQNFSLYSSLRFGVSLWYGSTSADIKQVAQQQLGGFYQYVEPYIENLNAAGGFSLESLQFTVLGMSINFAGRFGVYGEAALGSPYLLQIGINYRFFK